MDQLRDTDDVQLWIKRIISKLHNLNINDVAVDADHLKKCLMVIETLSGQTRVGTNLRRSKGTGFILGTTTAYTLPCQT